MTERELNRIIDGGLASYLADPVPGLDQRVQQAWTGQRTRPAGVWLALAGIAAAALLAVMWMPRADTPADIPAPAQIAIHTPAVPVLPVLRMARPAVRTKASSSRGIPMSEQERRLLRFAQSHPELMQQLFADAPLQIAEPLRIEPIVIKPLEAITSVGE